MFQNYDIILDSLQAQHVEGVPIVKCSTIRIKLISIRIIIIVVIIIDMSVYFISHHDGWKQHSKKYGQIYQHYSCLEH